MLVADFGHIVIYIMFSLLAVIFVSRASTIHDSSRNVDHTRDYWLVLLLS